MCTVHYVLFAVCCVLCTLLCALCAVCCVLCAVFCLMHAMRCVMRAVCFCDRFEVETQLSNCSCSPRTCSTFSKSSANENGNTIMLAYPDHLRLHTLITSKYPRSSPYSAFRLVDSDSSLSWCSILDILLLLVWTGQKYCDAWRSSKSTKLKQLESFKRLPHDHGWIAEWTSGHLVVSTETSCDPQS